MASENGKFKVGDRVRRVKETDSPDLFGEVGKEYTVLTAHAMGIGVVPGRPGADPNAFELVPAWQPKVGDRVRIVDPNLFMRGTKIGNLATIERIGASYIDILLEHPTEGIVSQIAKLEDIGPIAVVPASNDNAALAKPKFKVGDIVKRSNGYSPGRTLRITEVISQSNITAEWLDGGSGSTHRWQDYEFELIIPPHHPRNRRPHRERHATPIDRTKGPHQPGSRHYRGGTTCARTSRPAVRRLRSCGQQDR